MSDVHAAAERWRLANKAEEHKEYARSPYKGNFDLRLEDAYLLADAYLAEHPADDGEAIDEAWLRQNKWNPVDGIFGLPNGVFLVRWDTGWRIQVGGIDNMWEFFGEAPTRGQLRRLLAAIG